MFLRIRGLVSNKRFTVEANQSKWVTSAHMETPLKYQFLFRKNVAWKPQEHLLHLLLAMPIFSHQIRPANSSANQIRSSVHWVQRFYVSFKSVETDAGYTMHQIPLGNINVQEVCHTCSCAHWEHPVYSSCSPMIGFGVSAHCWQLEVARVEHAFLMTNF